MQPSGNRENYVEIEFFKINFKNGIWGFQKENGLCGGEVKKKTENHT